MLYIDFFQSQKSPLLPNTVSTIPNYLANSLVFIVYLFIYCLFRYFLRQGSVVWLSLTSWFILISSGITGVSHKVKCCAEPWTSIIPSPSHSPWMWNHYSQLFRWEVNGLDVINPTSSGALDLRQNNVTQESRFSFPLHRPELHFLSKNAGLKDAQRLLWTIAMMMYLDLPQFFKAKGSFYFLPKAWLRRILNSFKKYKLLS